MNIQNQLTTPTREQDALIRLLASRYVRLDNRFYHVDRPNVALNRRDVEQTFIHMIGRELPELPRDPGTLKAVFKIAIELQHTDPRRTVPVWSGQQSSYPGNVERLFWNDNGTVTINTWRQPQYRNRGVNQADYGRFQPLFETLFPNPQERDRVLDWVAWTLQNEDDRPTWTLLLYSKAKGTGNGRSCWRSKDQRHALLDRRSGRRWRGSRWCGSGRRGLGRWYLWIGKTAPGHSGADPP